MTEIKTNRELIIELRNRIAGRKIELEANARYWRYTLKRTKPDTQERVDANNNVVVNEQNARKDGDFIKCIDMMLTDKKYFQ